jgi:hypothetical protein
MFQGIQELKEYKNELFQAYLNEKNVLEKYIIENGRDKITIGQKAAAIGCLEVQFRRLDKSIGIFQELDFLDEFWNKQPAAHELKEYQQQFIHTIQNIVIEEHSDLSDFSVPNQTTDEKIRILDRITMINLDLKEKTHRDTVIYLYFFYLSLYRFFYLIQ